jgi:hypothetical protein
MTFLRSSWSSCLGSLGAALSIGALALVPALAVLVPTDAHASVSIAVGYDALVKDADAVGVVTPVESKTVWEEGRIVTYTRVKVDQNVAGDLGTGADGWVRTLGGVVGKIGQLVDGEPVFTASKSSLVFLRKFKGTGTWEVAARAQGQYPIVVDDTDKTRPAGQRRVMRSNAAGMLLPPKAASTVTAGPPAAGVVTKADPTLVPGAADKVAQLRLAGEVLHDRPLDEVTRDIATSWKKLHTAAPSTK